jgi:transketolase
MRTGRSPAASRRFQTPDFTLGRASVIRRGSDLTIIACGPLVNKAVEAAERLWDEDISVAVTNMSTIKPIDTHAIDLALDSTRALITLEDHSTIGGLGSAVAEYVGQTRPALVHRMGVDDVFGESGQAEELYAKYGLSVDDICQRVRMVVNNAV